MGGVAKDYGQFMLTFLKDTTLKTLMLIPTLEQEVYTGLIDKYFIESVTSGVITNTPIIRLLITANPQSSTNNMYVKSDMLAIEVFVPNLAPNNKDRVAGFERKSNQIVDRIIQLFNRKMINDRQLNLEARHELASGTPGFCRHYVCFSYKRVYS